MSSNRKDEIQPVPTMDTQDHVTDEKKFDDEFEIGPADDGKVQITSGGHQLDHDTPEMRNKIIAYYGRKAEDDALAPKEDVSVILDHILAMSEQEAMDILVHAIEYHRGE